MTPHSSLAASAHMLQSGGSFGAIKTDQGYFPLAPSQICSIRHIQRTTGAKISGWGFGGGWWGDSDSTDQLILTLCLWCGTQAPVGGAELWAEKAQQAHSNDAWKPHYVGRQPFTWHLNLGQITVTRRHVVLSSRTQSKYLLYISFVCVCLFFFFKFWMQTLQF